MSVRYYSGLKRTIVLIILISTTMSDAKIGINWGRRTSGSLIPSMVVDLLLQNRISGVKLYNINNNVIKAFAGTNISVTLVIPSLESITSLDMAKEWVQEKITPFDDVNIEYVIAGSNAFAVAKFSKLPVSIVMQSLNFVHNAINILGYGERVKAILTHSSSSTLILNSTLPSEASFIPEMMEPILQVLKFLNDTNTPFIFDFFPTGYIQMYNVDMNFAFFDNKSNYSITDVNGLQYHNALEAIYDSFVWALTKVGYGNLKISVGQIGWPTDGAANGNVRTAERFHKGLLPWVMSKVGTPMRPGIEIDIFIHSLVDEKQWVATLNPFVRHWGIYRTNGEPKYKIDFTGQGRDIYPTKVMGLNLMPSRWCVFNGDIRDSDKVQKQYEYACQTADCTSLAQGGSCDALSPEQRISYAFNGHFQANFQDEETCKFEGLGTVVTENPSTKDCIFIVEVVYGNKRVDSSTKWDNKPNPFVKA